VSCPTSSSDSRSSSRSGLMRSDEGGQRADNKGQSSSNEVGGVGGGEGRTKSYFVILFPAHYTGSAAQPSVATTARKEEEKKRK
jgi:hypothetical protein